MGSTVARSGPLSGSDSTPPEARSFAAMSAAVMDSLDLPDCCPVRHPKGFDSNGIPDRACQTVRTPWGASCASPFFGLHSRRVEPDRKSRATPGLHAGPSTNASLQHITAQTCRRLRLESVVPFREVHVETIRLSSTNQAVLPLVNVKNTEPSG